MKKHSIWEEPKDKQQNQIPLPKDTVDILIIGGGITGVTLAYFLKDLGKKIVLVEKDEIGNNVTSRSTAKISFLQRDIYQKLEKIFNYNTSKKYYEAQLYAIDILNNIINKNKIKCNLEKEPSYLFTNQQNKIKNIEKEKELLTSFGRKCFEVSKLPILFPSIKTFYVEDNYTFNPVKYLNCIEKIIDKDISIYKNTLVEEIIPESDFYKVKTSNGIINSKKVVIANQYPFFIKPGFIPLKNYIKREYVVAAKYKEGLNFNAINIESNLQSIRFYKDYLIYVSNEHRLTNKLNYKINYQKSRKDFYNYFTLEPEYNWVNQDLMTNDHLPIIGEINKNLYISTGYNAWGMTNGVLGAKIISDLIKEQKNMFSELVKPQRFSITGLLNSIIDSILYIKPYIESPFCQTNITIEEENGIKYNVYIDKDGNKHRVKRKCPHLKCNLILNEEELTWDCPCHGSRFDIDGNLIEGPSKKNI